MTQGPTAVFLMGYLPCHVCELGDLECEQQCCSPTLVSWALLLVEIPLTLLSPSNHHSRPKVRQSVSGGNTANSYHLTILLPAQSTFPIGQLRLSRYWDIPQGPAWWRGRRWPQECSEDGKAVVGSPQSAPYFQITTRQESLVESQIIKVFTKRQKCRGFGVPPPHLMWNLYF